jgi:hypothetical protein
MNDISVVEKDGVLTAVTPSGEEYTQPANKWMLLGANSNTMRDGSDGVSVYETFGGQRVEFFSCEDDEFLAVYVYNFASNEWKEFTTIATTDFNDEGIALPAIHDVKCTLRAFYQIVDRDVATREQIGEALTTQ